MSEEDSVVVRRSKEELGDFFLYDTLGSGQEFDVQILSRFTIPATQLSSCL